MRILIVEDEEQLARALKKGLEKNGYAADYVLDGEIALRRIEMYSKEYDLVILDLLLPKKNGFEVCETARARGITTPILVLTARDMTEDKIAALDKGADDYLQKPFSFEELLARVRALLRRPKAALPLKLRSGELELDEAARKVRKNGREINLTVKEFMLLEYLMRHPNQVLNRGQIADHLYGFDFDSFSNVVDVHLKNLRKKIYGENFGQNLAGPNPGVLETVRGVGYRLKA